MTLITSEQEVIYLQGQLALCTSAHDRLAALCARTNQSRLEALARVKTLEQGLKVIYTTARGDEKSECWTIRKWLDERNIFNDDNAGAERLIAEVCKAALAGTAPTRAVT